MSHKAFQQLKIRKDMFSFHIYHQEHPAHELQVIIVKYYFERKPSYEMNVFYKLMHDQRKEHIN